MALGSNQQTITTGANFIPEVWINEVRAYLEANLVLAARMKNFQFEGKKGDILHVPDVTVFTTTAKSANTQVTLQSPTEDQFTLTINRHRESSFLVEDMLAIQNAYDLRQHYTKNSGYAIAREIDTTLGTLYFSVLNTDGVGIINGNGVTWSSGAVSVGSDLTEAGLRFAIERLDTANVPDDGNRCLWIHPAQKNALLAIARFTEYQMLGPGGMPIRTGQFGEIFGVPVYISTQTSLSVTAHGNMLFHKDFGALAIQSAPRVQADYILEYLGWLFVVDVVYGYNVFRANHGVTFMTPQ